MKLVGAKQCALSGLASKNEAEVLVAVSAPRVLEVMVTLLPLMLTTPVKSSMSSS